MNQICVFRIFATLSLAIGLGAGALFGQGEAASVNLAEELERGIFLHEGKADLSAAAKVYQSILEESKLVDSLAAEARYRLALVYLDEGKRLLANQLLKEIVDLYPDQARWVEEAKAILPQEFVPETTPWHEGERVYFDWKLPTGDVIGKSMNTMTRYEWDGRKLWRKECRYLLNGNRAMVLEFDPETFASVYSHAVLGDLGSIRAWYGEDCKSVRVEYAKSGEEKTFNFSESVFDNEQAYELMRQMPAEVGYRMHKALFVSFAGSQVGVTFEVTSIEELDTAIGRVECYEVTIDLIMQQQTAYITTDDRRLVVKLVAGGVNGVLSKVETVDYASELTYEDLKFGYTFDYPGSWGTFVLPQARKVVHIVEPLARGTYFLIESPKDDWNKDRELNAESLGSFLLKEISEDFRGYSKEEGWIGERSLDLDESGSFKLSKPEGDKRESLYVYYGIGDEAFYALVGNISSDDEGELRSKFEGIVSSFQLVD